MLMASPQIFFKTIIEKKDPNSLMTFFQFSDSGTTYCNWLRLQQKLIWEFQQLANKFLITDNSQQIKSQTIKQHSKNPYLFD